MTPEELEDEGGRPRAPDVPGLSPAQRAHGGRLAQIHDMYRDELAAVAALLAEIRAARADPATLVPVIEGLDLARNLALFGTVCGRECALLKNHHDIEEHWMFPALAERADPALQAVIDRLIAEHRVIHALIADLREAATTLTAQRSPAAFDACATAFDTLNRAIQSHFGYEETQLHGALGAHAIPI
ncbi:hemerythrin domain-containing protein [Paracoccus salsus]|uniref:hemerythrin domain-containing protein n=1 Tax=Paracoccus salsus TaxID=2911061 RepID=UPI001F200FE4|nr:hemerythrin domain-containing protein [Paracoccus salsus]MCF3972761.1 hemerythrin domain-containing protein [Paracoccus salsus]